MRAGAARGAVGGDARGGRGAARKAVLVDRWVRWHAGHQRVAASLAGEDLRPELIGIGAEGVIGCGRFENPISLLELGVQLAWSPSRMAREGPGRQHVRRVIE